MEQRAEREASAAPVDTIEITNLVLRERQGRDRGWWAQMRACYDDAAMIDLNWYRGDADGFVDASRRQHEAGRRATHRLSPPVASVRGDRAIIEASAALETRNVVDGVECDLISYLRLLYRAAERGGTWRLTSLRVIYERDSLVAVRPGQVPALDLELLGSLRSSYRFLAYVQRRIGWPSRDDLPGDDQPGVVAGLYDDQAAWLAGSGAETSHEAPY
jgi:hypothetical protein